MISERYDRIKSAGDRINPPELGTMERKITKVKRGRFVLLPITAETRAHGTHSLPAGWGKYLAELLAESRRSLIGTMACCDDAEDEDNGLTR